MTAREIAAELTKAIDEGVRLFGGADEQRTAVKPADGGWCAREVLGHLIDSACNNHRRFIVGQSPDIARFDGYEGEQWVERQRYAERPWRELLALWVAYNRHLAHVIASAPQQTLAHSAEAPGGGAPVTLGFLMQDYVDHMRGHFDQIARALRGA